MAERIKLSAFLYLPVWITVVYEPSPLGMGGGGGRAMGFLILPGGAVFQIMWFCGAALLCLSETFRVWRILSRSQNTGTLLGAGLLWFGWGGFNGGSALAANGLAVNAVVVTNTSAAAGALAWLFVSWFRGRPSSLGMVSGAVAGLGAITPCAGYVTPMWAIVIGALRSALVIRLFMA